MKQDYSKLAEKYLKCGNEYNSHAMGIRNFAKWLSNPICVGDSVNVPDPINDDFHSHAFVGTVAELYGVHPEMAMVEDQDGECFSIETDRLTLNDE